MRNLFPPDETLTGVVQEKAASDIEERSARAIDKMPDWNYTFRIRISPLTGQLTETFQNIAGEYEIDFLCMRGNEMKPILIDGEVSHFLASWQKVIDEEKETMINTALKKYGAHPVQRVEFWKLAEQERADITFREILL